jgi:serine phosphatase RsbU (regulator of sigma subunit)
VVAGPELELTYANPAMQELSPLHAELAEHVGHVIASGIQVTGLVLPGRRPGEWLDYTLAPLKTGVLVHAVDVSNLAASLAREREARREAQLAAERTARLQRVTDALSVAVGAEDVMRLIVSHAQEAMGADAGVIALPDGEDVAVGSHSGYSPESMGRWQRFPLAAQLPLSESVRSGELVFVSTEAEWASRYPELAPEVVMPGLAVAPFVFEDEVLGAMALSFREPRHFTAEERTFLSALGRQCAQALERARLYEERAYVARTLQEGLLPGELSAAPAVDAAVRYASIADGGEVGGDFYDFFDTGPERWLAVVGDVCGKGTQAAVLTGLARHTLRAIAMREPEPEGVLGFLNDTLRRHAGGAAYCTVVMAAIEPAATGLRARIVSAGHPPPLLLRAAGALETPAATGTLLGVETDLELEPQIVSLAPGDALVLYTDGVTDARGEDGEDFGEERLRDAVATAAGATADGIAAAVDAAVRAHERGAARDDRAILVLRAKP